jgi:hypothetical protein
VKRRIWLAIASGVLSSSFAVAQTDSHFDLSGNMSFNGATFAPAAGGSSVQVNTFGWQTSGVTRLNRWFGITSQFGAGYASSNAITLIGYTGPGTVRHYSMLAGPRIILSRGRFSPFIEGLAGADRASTNLVSNGTPVTGRELQTAYAFGGGAQIAMSRHFGLNFEGQYFGTQHTLAFTGWEPAHFQISAGIVIRMFGRDRQISEQRPLPPPSEPAIIEPAPQPTIAGVEVPSPPSSFAIVQPATPVIVVTPIAVSQPVAAFVEASHTQKQQPIVAVQPTIQPTIARVEVPAARVQKQQPIVSLQTPAPAVSAPKVEPVVTAKVVAPTVSVAQTQPAPQQLAAAPRPPVMAQTQPVQRPQSAPMSLGEYARRLREKKQQEQRQ